MNQITCTKRLILIVIVAISLTNIAYAQTIKSKTTQSPTKSIQNCGCDYMPLCNPFSEKIFDFSITVNDMILSIFGLAKHLDIDLLWHIEHKIKFLDIVYIYADWKYINNE